MAALHLKFKVSLHGIQTEQVTVKHLNNSKHDMAWENNEKTLTKKGKKKKI